MITETVTLSGIYNSVAAILWGVLTPSLSGRGVPNAHGPPLFTVTLLYMPCNT